MLDRHTDTQIHMWCVACSAALWCLARDTKQSVASSNFVQTLVRDPGRNTEWRALEPASDGATLPPAPTTTILHFEWRPYTLNPQILSNTHPSR